jgi:hypothetical protein
MSRTSSRLPESLGAYVRDLIESGAVREHLLALEDFIEDDFNVDALLPLPSMAATVNKPPLEQLIARLRQDPSLEARAKASLRSLLASMQREDDERKEAMRRTRSIVVWGCRGGGLLPGVWVLERREMSALRSRHRAVERRFASPTGRARRAYTKERVRAPLRLFLENRSDRLVAVSFKRGTCCEVAGERVLIGLELAGGITVPLSPFGSRSVVVEVSPGRNVVSGADRVTRRVGGGAIVRLRDGTIVRSATFVTVGGVTLHALGHPVGERDEAGRRPHVPRRRGLGQPEERQGGPRPLPRPG